MSWNTKDKILKEGDIVNVDVTALKDGWHGDTSRMYFVGEVSTKAKKLVKTTYEAMIKSIKILKRRYSSWRYRICYSKTC